MELSISYPASTVSACHSLRTLALSGYAGKLIGRSGWKVIVTWNKRLTQHVFGYMTNRATRISARILLRCGIALLAIAIGSVGVLAGPPERADAIDKLMTTLHERGQFNGAILVAEHGDVLYRRGFGKADIGTGTAFAPDTLSDIGSVTKQFTAMAIMMLAERRRLSYDDLISRYIPEFSGASHLGRITVRQLLTHTSGIPDYGDVGIDDSGLNQTSLIAALLKRDADVSKPGMTYRYSNVGMRCSRLSFKTYRASDLATSWLRKSFCRVE